MLSDALMDSLSGRTLSFKRNVLNVKEYMRALYLLDIVTPDGKCILESAWAGNRLSHVRQSYFWRRTCPPTSYAVADWQDFLKTNVFWG